MRTLNGGRFRSAFGDLRAPTGGCNSSLLSSNPETVVLASKPFLRAAARGPPPS
jgi:hypothetical protein